MTRHLLILLAMLPPLAAGAQTQPQSVRVTNGNGQSVAVVTNTTPGTGDYGLAVRCISGCSGGGGGGGGTSSVFGAAFPANGTAAGYSDGTNMQGARVFDGDTGAGAQYVIGAMLRASGSGGTVETGTTTNPLQVQSNSANIATEATLAKLPVTQGSTTSGQSGTLVQGAVTTAAPSYTNAQTSPLSLTTAGALRVDGSGSSQPVTITSLPLEDGVGTVFANQQAVTASAVALSTVSAKRACVRHLYGGSQDVIYVGPSGVSTSTGFALYAGDAICRPVSNENLLYVIAAGTGSSVSVVGVY